MKTYITKEVLQTFIDIFVHSPQGMLIGKNTSHFQILESEGLIHWNKEVGFARLNIKGDNVAYLMLSTLRDAS